MYVCVYLCTFLYISGYTHLSSKDAPRDLRQKTSLVFSLLFLELHQLSKSFNFFFNFQKFSNVQKPQKLTFPDS